MKSTAKGEYCKDRSGKNKSSQDTKGYKGNIHVRDLGIGSCGHRQGAILTKNFINGTNLGNALGPCVAKRVEMKLRNEEVKELGVSKK